MRVNRSFLMLTILTICLIVESIIFLASAVFFLAYFLIFFVLALLKTPIRIRTLIESILIFVLGIWFIVWLNVVINPTYVLAFGLPMLFPQILWSSIVSWELMLLSLLIFVPSICLLAIFLYSLKGSRSLFFLGASLVSIFYAGWSLIEIAQLYHANVGYALPDINIEGYSFPAIYTFKLFRSLFFATFFTLLGHLNNIGILGKIVAKFGRLRRKKEKQLTDFF